MKPSRLVIVLVAGFATALLGLGACSAAVDRGPGAGSGGTPGAGVHSFYYLWYGSPEGPAGEYKHWNHEVLPHWTDQENRRFANSIGTRFQPPEKLHSVYYPARGPYDSRDERVIAEHVQDFQAAGLSTMVLSWWGRASMPGTTDTQNVSTDVVCETVVHTLEQLCQQQRQQRQEGQEGQEGACETTFAFHLEPYPGRSAETVREDVRDLLERFGGMRSFLHIDGRPVFYVYDSYHIPVHEWQRMLTPDGDLAVRGGPNDGVFIGLWLDRQHGEDLWRAGFDGLYTYFATDGFSYGSTTRHWPQLCAFAREHDMLCVLSAGPGYADWKIRPWNEHNTRAREGTAYYERMLAHAVDAGPDIISITSFNEWGEGTQIEPAVHHHFSSPDGAVADYPPYEGDNPRVFLELTRQYRDSLLRQQQEHSPPREPAEL